MKAKTKISAERYKKEQAKKGRLVAGGLEAGSEQDSMHTCLYSMHWTVLYLRGHALLLLDELLVGGTDRLARQTRRTAREFISPC